MLRVCPECGKTVITNGIPKYCPWGCRTLEGTTIYTVEEYYKIIPTRKTRKNSITSITQLKLF